MLLFQSPPLFVWNLLGGRTAAIRTCLTSSNRHDVCPQLYLTQMLTNLPTTRMCQQPKLLPDQLELQQAACRRSLYNSATTTA
jgi:hypothetical protein